MTRRRLLLLWMLCAAIAPLLVLAMLAQSIFGSVTRAQAMAIAFDECGNAMLGGDARETISRRAGLALIAGKRWGRIAVPIIDRIFGAGHCSENTK